MSLVSQNVFISVT